MALETEDFDFTGKIRLPFAKDFLRHTCRLGRVELEL